jgi:hypothetical protein
VANALPMLACCMHSTVPPGPRLHPSMEPSCLFLPFHCLLQGPLLARRSRPWQASLLKEGGWAPAVLCGEAVPSAAAVAHPHAGSRSACLGVDLFRRQETPLVAGPAITAECGSEGVLEVGCFTLRQCASASSPILILLPWPTTGWSTGARRPCAIQRTGNW